MGNNACTYSSTRNQGVALEAVDGVQDVYIIKSFSARNAHELRHAIAEMKDVSPSSVEIYRHNGASKIVVGNTDSLRTCGVKARLSTRLKSGKLSVYTCSSDGSAKKHDADSGELIASYDHPAAVNAFCLTKCGCFLYTACADGVIRKFDSVTTALVKSFKSRGDAFFHVALSPCEEYVFGSATSKVTEKFDIQTGNRTDVFYDHVGGNSSLQLSTCGTFIYKMDGSNSVARKYNWQTGELIRTYGNENEDVAVLAVALGHCQNDNEVVFTGCSNGSVSRFNENGSVGSFQCHTEEVSCISCR